MLLKEKEHSSEKDSLLSFNKLVHFPLIKVAHAIMLLTALLLCILVLFLIIRFDAFSPEVKIFIPRSFFVATVTMLVASFSVHSLVLSIKTNKWRAAMFCYAFTVLCGVAFLFGILTGWRELAFNDHQFSLEWFNASMMVFLISVEFFVMVFVVVALTTFFACKFISKARSLVGQLIISTNPYELKRVKKIAQLWYFLSSAWLLAFFIFVIGKMN